MNKLHIFTDVSLNATLAIGIGASVIITEEQLQIDQPKGNIKLKKFTTTSSTQLEIACLLWALKDVKKKADQLKIYTDSQCIVGLLDRRERLEQKEFKSGKTKEALNNAELYKQFYSLYDQLNFEVIKIKGHTKQKDRDVLHQLFSTVDKASRKELKKCREKYKS